MHAEQTLQTSVTIHNWKGLDELEGCEKMVKSSTNGSTTAGSKVGTPLRNWTARTAEEAAVEVVLWTVSLGSFSST